MNNVTIDTEKKFNQTPQGYIQSLCDSKENLKLTWKQIANICNAELGLTYSVSWYRKNYQNGSFANSHGVTQEVGVDPDACGCDDDSPFNAWEEDLMKREADLADKTHKILLRRAEVSDIMAQNNAYIRRLSREQTLKEIANDYANVMSREKRLPVPAYSHEFDVHDAEGILLLSDWHYGMVCDNPWNKFDPDVCRARVNRLLNKVIDLIDKNSIKCVHVLDLADLIAGRIHTQIRIESRFDVITQSMEVCEILAEFLTQLSIRCDVKFYSCLDNHSRLEPNKKESMDLESLARLIPWYLKSRLAGNNAVQICENIYGADIITCKIAGHNVIGVHGDNDRPTTALERLSLMTHQHYDMLCTAHLHHFSADEQHQSMVVSNGSLMGVDRYAEKLRLTSDPSQTFIVASPDNVCEAIYRIVLK